jgi:hypothetical protein
VDLLGAGAHGRVRVHAPRDEAVHLRGALPRHAAGQVRAGVSCRVESEGVHTSGSAPLLHSPHAHRTYKSAECQSAKQMVQTKLQDSSTIAGRQADSVIEVIKAHRSSRVWPRSGRSPVTSSHSTTPNEKICRMCRQRQRSAKAMPCYGSDRSSYLKHPPKGGEQADAIKAQPTWRREAGQSRHSRTRNVQRSVGRRRGAAAYIYFLGAARAQQQLGRRPGKLQADVNSNRCMAHAIQACAG